MDYPIRVITNPLKNRTRQSFPGEINHGHKYCDVRQYIGQKFLSVRWFQFCEGESLIW